MGRVTTHVLDLALGRPAENLLIELYFLDDAESGPLTRARTNADGRIDGPIVEGAALRRGEYELRFHAGDYLRKQSQSLPEPLFLDVIPIRFGIADTDGHYHVPLLLSPFGYSTYRGS